MSLAFIFGTNLLNYDPQGVAEFHETEPVVQQLYGHVSDWTGLDLDTLLRRATDNDNESESDIDGDIETESRHGSIALAAAMIGIHDVLSERGIHPAALGGLSLGAMVSSCLAGVLPRRQLFELLLEIEHVGPRDPNGRPEGVAVAFVPVEQDPARYYGRDQEGVFLGGDFGTHPSGTFRILLLTGYRDALVRLAAESAEGSVLLQEANTVAVHSPLRRSVYESVARHMAGVELTDPVLPLCSSLGPETLTTGAEVRTMFARNAIDTIRIDDMSAELHRHKVRMGLVLGPSLPRGWITFPFPVVHIERPSDLAEMTSAIFEFGIALPPRTVR
jgi:[acyl-carrier-protein] S-malonyltransferase